VKRRLAEVKTGLLAALIVAAVFFRTSPTWAQSCAHLADEQAHIAEQRDNGVPLKAVYKHIDATFPDNVTAPEVLRSFRARLIAAQKNLAAQIYKSGKSAAAVRDESLQACEQFKLSDSMGQLH
jgi:hypothetical protein